MQSGKSQILPGIEVDHGCYGNYPIESDLLPVVTPHQVELVFAQVSQLVALKVINLIKVRELLELKYFVELSSSQFIGQ